MATGAERAWKCYRENPAYREAARARGRRWYRKNKPRAIQLQRRRRQLARLAERWINERRATT